MTIQHLPTALNETADEQQPQPRTAQGDVLAYQTVIGPHLVLIREQRDPLGLRTPSLAGHRVSAEGWSR
ncbi:hypothetical protein PV518_32250 [Streptomyces sp. ND04-05B]|uniref:hypothetical protein n=1 Tax=Streptomyces sp. ND04-05B TaxID=3028693 RepID=UPI0029AA5FD0|nr:hypothetical protein [Streptomyces sp. ND04-05B]MDX3066795.1 hypothetical protein [Streptomyces sp. ND04-05B]